MQIKHILAIAALAAAATAAHAGPKNDGPYALVEAGVSHQSGLDSAADKAGYGITFGTKVARNVALETSYKHLGERHDMKFEALSFAAVATYPLNKSFDLLGKAGVARTSLSASEGGLTGGLHRTGFVLGAGVDYKINKDWAVRGMLETYPDFAGLDEPLTSLSVGVKYTF